MRYVRVQRQGHSPELALNGAALAGYLKQIREACDAAGAPGFVTPLLAGVLALPGVAPESTRAGAPPETS